MRQKDNQICISIFILHAIMHAFTSFMQVLILQFMSFSQHYSTLPNTCSFWFIFLSIFPYSYDAICSLYRKKDTLHNRKKIQIISAAAYIILYAWRFMGQIRDSQVCFARMDYTHCYNYNNQLHCLCRVYTLHVLLLFIFLFFVVLFVNHTSALFIESHKVARWKLYLPRIVYTQQPSTKSIVEKVREN